MAGHEARRHKAPWLLHLEAMTRDRSDPRLAPLVGDSPAMRLVRERLAAALDERHPVLLVGEPGTGKTLAARLLHAGWPPRGAAFQALDGDAPGLERALFGVGEAPGAVNRGGTLLIRRAERLTPELQARLHRAHVDRWCLKSLDLVEVPRLVFACDAADHDGPLRHPGLARATVRIDLPPLRARLDDLPLLAEHLLRDERSADGHPLRLRPAALEAFSRHAWPGNVAELVRVLRDLARRPGRGALARPQSRRAEAPLHDPEAARPAEAAAPPPADPPVAWRPLPAPPRPLRPPRFGREGLEAAVSAALVFTAAMSAGMWLIGP